MLYYTVLYYTIRERINEARSGCRYALSSADPQLSSECGRVLASNIKQSRFPQASALKGGLRITSCQRLHGMMTSWLATLAQKLPCPIQLKGPHLLQCEPLPHHPGPQPLPQTPLWHLSVGPSKRDLKAAAKAHNSAASCNQSCMGRVDPAALGMLVERLLAATSQGFLLHGSLKEPPAFRGSSVSKSPIHVPRFSTPGPSSCRDGTKATMEGRAHTQVPNVAVLSAMRPQAEEKPQEDSNACDNSFSSQTKNQRAPTYWRFSRPVSEEERKIASS